MLRHILLRYLNTLNFRAPLKKFRAPFNFRAPAGKKYVPLLFLGSYSVYPKPWSNRHNSNWGVI